MIPSNPTELSHRLWVAVVLPLNQDESIDEMGFRKLLQYFIAAQKKQPDLGIIVNPEAGDIVYLSPEEQLRLIQIALEEVSGRMPVFSGVAANATKDIVKVAEAAAKTGINGLFLAPPCGAADITYGLDSVRYPEIWSDQIEAITDAVPDMPIICHPAGSISFTYGLGLPVEPTLEMLNRFPQIIGWKLTYAYGGSRKISRAIKSLDHHVAQLPAMAVYLHENLAEGDIDGALTGSFNFALEPMLAHINAWRRGDVNKAREIWNGGLAELQEYIYDDYTRGHIRYKTACWLRGHIDSPYLRSPMPKPQKAELQYLYHLLSKVKVSLISQAKVDKFVATLEK
ncbi:dihydrodipicolinate synthetase [Hypocenomyce scalaris]|nr:dihydrodipicolinate synthetase [Hypocenomyce scalaris]